MTKTKQTKASTNKQKYEEAKKIVDTMVYNYETKDYEFLSDRNEREYGHLENKAVIVGVLDALSDTSYFQQTKEEMRQKLDTIHWILVKHGERLYQSDFTHEEAFDKLFEQK